MSEVDPRTLQATISLLLNMLLPEEGVSRTIACVLWGRSTSQDSIYRPRYGQEAVDLSKGSNKQRQQ